MLFHTSSDSNHKGLCIISIHEYEFDLNWLQEVE